MQIISGIPITRYWLVPAERRPKMFMPHPTMSSEQLRQRTSVGRVFQFCAPSGGGLVALQHSRPAWRSCLSQSSIARCTQAQALRPIAPAWPRQRVSPDGWQNPAYGFSRRVPCQNCKTHGGRKPFHLQFCAEKMREVQLKGLAPWRFRIQTLVEVTIRLS